MTTPEPVSPAPDTGLAEDLASDLMSFSEELEEWRSGARRLPMVPAPDTEALRQQVAHALNQCTSTPFANEVSLAATVDAVLALPWIKYAAGQRLAVTAHERNNAAIAETNRQFAEENAGLRADLDRVGKTADDLLRAYQQACAERDALSELLRGMARRVGEVREEMRFATGHIGQWQKVAQRLRSQRDSARNSRDFWRANSGEARTALRELRAVVASRPATPDDAAERGVTE